MDTGHHVLDTGTSGSVAMGPGPAAWSSPWLTHCSLLTYLYLELLCRKYLLYRRHDNLARMSLEYEMTHGLFKRKSKIPFYVELNSNGFYSTLETYKKGHNLVVISL